jgi:hypothetical protein
MKTEKITITNVTAEYGKTFMRGESVIGKVIYLGVNDTIDNYTQVSDEDLPKVEERNQEGGKDEKDLELAQGEQ